MNYSSRYSKDEVPPFPVLHFVLFDPLSQRSMEMSAKIDTGFSGSLLIPLEDYVKLGLQMHEEPKKTISGRLVTGGAISLQSSRGIIKLGDDKLNSLVYTTPIVMRPLFGRDLLKFWRTELNGPKDTLKIS